MIKAVDYYRQKSGEGYAREVLKTGPEELRAMARIRARKLRKHIGPDDNVLEIGVGLGVNLQGIGCAEKVGQDLGEFAEEACRKNGIHFVGDLSALTGRTFSIVLMHHVLEHVPNPMEFLEKARPFLAPGGKLLVFVPDDTHRRERRYVENERNKHLFSWSPLTLGNLIKASGYQLNSVGVGAFGYERRLAPIARYGDLTYRSAIEFARLIRPVREIRIVAGLDDLSPNNDD